MHSAVFNDIDSSPRIFSHYQLIYRAVESQRRLGLHSQSLVTF